MNKTQKPNGIYDIWYSRKRIKNFYEEKINTAKYFFDKILPRIDSHYHSAIAGSESLMKAKFN